MTTIRIPTPLRPYTAGEKEISVRGETVGAALQDLTERYPELRQHLFEGEDLRSFVNLYLNQEDVRYLQGTDTALQEQDTLMIIPSIAGGSARAGRVRHANCGPAGFHKLSKQLESVT